MKIGNTWSYENEEGKEVVMEVVDITKKKEGKITISKKVSE